MIENEEQIYVFLDESGHIHKNDSCTYFAIGGYMCLSKDRKNIQNEFIKYNKLKKTKIKNKDKELKSYDYTQNQKAQIFESVAKYETFYGIAKVFDKEKMWKKISDEDIFYNYSVRVLFSDIIKKEIPEFDPKKHYNIIIALDNRTIRQSKYMKLEDYLNHRYRYSNIIFNVCYYDSKENYEIQLADLIINTIFNRYQNYKKVDKIIPRLDKDKFKYGMFPGYKHENSNVKCHKNGKVKMS